MRSREAFAPAAGLIVLAIGAIAWPAGETIDLDRSVIRPDGRSTARISATSINVLGGAAWLGRRPPVRVDSNETGASILEAHDGSVILRAGHRPGAVHLATPKASAILRIEGGPEDQDRDGLPDAAELLTEEDRAAFTSWFVTIAEAQATATDDAWADVHRDCAGLIRFAYKSALVRHDAAWLAKRRYLPSIGHPDVAAFHYPDLPILGDRPFRAIAGPFDPRAARDVQFTAAAGARALFEHNTSPISRDLAGARAGDLSFFSVPHGAGSRMHSMILLGARPGATHHEPAARVVYHTGDGDRGEVRLLSIDELLHHPDPSWHPVPHNSRFLGVRRLALVHHEPMQLSSLELEIENGGLR
jgi:hypothetical protein